jgi:hypothetical protein
VAGLRAVCRISAIIWNAPLLLSNVLFRMPSKCDHNRSCGKRDETLEMNSPPNARFRRFGPFKFWHWRHIYHISTICIDIMLYKYCLKYRSPISARYFLTFLLVFFGFFLASVERRFSRRYHSSNARSDNEVYLTVLSLSVKLFNADARLRMRTKIF